MLMTPNDQVPPSTCPSCWNDDEWTWTDDDPWECEVWVCDICGAATAPPDPSNFYRCPNCAHPFRDYVGQCPKCGGDWSDLVEAQA